MGRVLAVDPGTVRVGLALSDPLRITAAPLEVVAATEAVERISQICVEMAVDTVVVGLATKEDGAEGESAGIGRDLAAALETACDAEVVIHDERYTSRMATEIMVNAGEKRRGRREKLDKVAAAVLLRSYLDHSERNQA